MGLGSAVMAETLLSLKCGQPLLSNCFPREPNGGSDCLSSSDDRGFLFVVNAI
jgi:hypothetical protein